MSVGWHIEVRGVVQGVGFRPWVYNLARTSGLTGSVSNDAAGVIIEAFARTEGDLDAFLVRLRAEPPPAARIEGLSWAAIPVAAPPRASSRWTSWPGSSGCWSWCSRAAPRSRTCTRAA